MATNLISFHSQPPESSSHFLRLPKPPPLLYSSHSSTATSLLHFNYKTSVNSAQRLIIPQTQFSKNQIQFLSPMASVSKSKILFIGGTGYIGKFIVEASAKAGHPTYALVRKSTLSAPRRSEIVSSFRSLGVNFLIGDLNDHGSLVDAMKKVDVVISTVGHGMLTQQVKIIAAIKEAGNVKKLSVNIIQIQRFFPSEFGNDVDRVVAVEPAQSAYDVKVRIRRAVEAEGIPFTYVSCNCFAGYFLSNLAQPSGNVPPRDKVIILGDGNAKAVFNREEDIGTYTIRAVDDPRTLNKLVYIRPPNNIYSFNDLVSLWERKIEKKLERVYVPEEEILKHTRGDVMLALNHSILVKGCQTSFEIEDSFGVEASEIYPDVKYTTVDEYLDQFV
ncbi:Phenylcoumaran benzylic ether reductase 1 [Linum perenne]